jgi:hypothetical protein
MTSLIDFVRTLFWVYCYVTEVILEPTVTSVTSALMNEDFEIPQQSPSSSI